MVTQVEFADEPIVPERIVPGKTPIYLFQKHASRYQFIGEAITGKCVLDAGCGDGYGAYYLAQRARKVVGIDVAPEVVKNARDHYKCLNLSFEHMDCIQLSFPSMYFDAVCAFEVFEHIPKVEKLLEESHRVLRSEGIFFVSTPNVKSYVAAGNNPWHIKEYTYREFYKLLTQYFPTVEIFGQFCQRPLRRSLYQLSSRLYFDSRIYRLLIHYLASVYIRHIGRGKKLHKTDWVESTRPNLFRFMRDNADQADSFLAVCRKTE